jgi:hypothetical protein
MKVRKFGDFFKRIKLSEKDINKTEHNSTQQVKIQIEGNIDLFKDEKEKIILGAKQLLEMGKADDKVDAIITFATMFRGLRFKETKRSEDGTVIVVLRETAQQNIVAFKEDNERDL